jgi:hypothetical protein
MSLKVYIFPLVLPSYLVHFYLFNRDFAFFINISLRLSAMFADKLATFVLPTESRF